MVADSCENIVYIGEKFDHEGHPMPFFGSSWAINCPKQRIIGGFFLWQYQSGVWLNLANGEQFTDLGLGYKFDFFCTPFN